MNPFSGSKNVIENFGIPAGVASARISVLLTGSLGAQKVPWHGCRIFVYVFASKNGFENNKTRHPFPWTKTDAKMMSFVLQFYDVKLILSCIVFRYILLR